LSISDVTATQAAIAGAAAVSLIGYAVFILAPAWAAYGRLGERVAASFLTLFILATLMGIGVAIGLALVWGYTSIQ
jgi:hypothetical protein